MPNIKFNEDRIYAAFADKMIVDKGISGLDQRQRAKLRQQLKVQLIEAVDKALIAALPDKQLVELSDLLDGDDVKEDDMVRIFDSAKLDYNLVVQKAMREFRDEFLAKKDDEILAEVTAEKPAEGTTQAQVSAQVATPAQAEAEKPVEQSQPTGIQAEAAPATQMGGNGAAASVAAPNQTVMQPAPVATQPEAAAQAATQTVQTVAQAATPVNSTVNQVAQAVQAQAQQVVAATSATPTAQIVAQSQNVPVQGAEPSTMTIQNTQATTQQPAPAQVVQPVQPAQPAQPVAPANAAAVDPTAGATNNSEENQ